MIGLKGSPCGFGTDIGGSIRFPAGFNGLYGIRPSSGRLPYQGIANSLDGQNTILSVVGPIATSLGALKLLIKAILSEQPWLHDPLVHEIPWRDEQEQQILSLAKSTSNSGQVAFGIIRHDGYIKPHPPILRAIDITIKTLENLGHKIIEWAPPSHRKCIDIVEKTWVYDGAQDVHSAFALSGEPLSKQIATFRDKPFREYTATEIAQTNVAQREYKKEYMEYWNGTSAITGTGRPVDAVICPVAPFAAARPGTFTYYGYTAWFNMLDYSASTFPVCTVDQNTDKLEEDYVPLNEDDTAASESYDPTIFHNTPVSLQLIGRRLQEGKKSLLSPN